MILFHKLLKSNNQDAKNTHDEYVKNQNKEQFYTKIINLCRNMNHVTTKEDGKPSQRREQNRRVCYLFPEGKCLRGNECKFEHIIDRHVEGDSHREKKDTKPVCMYYESGGVCKKADRCKFKHPNGVKEGNFWRNPSHSKQQNEVIEEEVIVQTTERKETEITETKISSPSLLSNQSSEYLNGDDAEEPVGRSLLRDSENQSDNSLPLDAVDNSANIKLDLDSSNANQGNFV